MILFIALTVILVVLIHWLLTSPYGYWKKKGVPHPEPYFLTGNLGPTLTTKKNLGQIYRDMYYDFKDLLYVGYYKFRKPGLVLRDMDLIKSVLVKEFSSFHDNEIEVDEKLDPLFGNNPFVLRGQKWKEVRNLVTSGITNNKVKNMMYLMINAAKNMVNYLETNPEVTGSDGIETKELAAKYTTDVVASCAFGVEANCFTSAKSEFREMGKKFLSPSFWNSIKITVMWVLPSISKLLRIRFMPSDVQKWFITITKETINYRTKNNIVRNDYLDMLIALKNSTAGRFHDMDIAAQALTFYGDGFETSAITISHTLYEIAEHPEVQQRLRDEIQTVLNKHGGEITYESVQEMTYLDNVLSESLRKNSPILFMVRVCTKPYEFPPPKGAGTGPNITIEPGTAVVIPVLAIHYDPQYYPDPHKFDPDRFTEENKATRPRYTYLPFGEGPRICLGSKFGVAQTKVALIAILSNFEITVNRKTQRPLKMDPKYFMTCALGGLWLNFTKIKK